ncbi:MAG TPA: 50S ribosomal protein L15 [Candidatus Goldiibacteriota bacterium]|nr:50S ribosomal protein L15 [Candidatus Goldiibacteriota bacterium]HPI03232.1 50S ribosomal protein L15 [Candidatus Goldiibacteriota bacterium]HRQ42956.1 50S ribosomal protein L15 [Candidatus Goldiibacteriota bacterium]
MKFSDLKITKSKRKKKTRIGRGTGSGMGKTAAYGAKGQRARSGGAKAPWFEGGQQRLTQRIPKSGFNNPFPTEYEIVNVSTLDKKFEAGATVDAASLYAKRCINSKDSLVKVLGDGEITKALNVKVNKLSKTAEEKIKKAGGEVIA